MSPSDSSRSPSTFPPSSVPSVFKFNRSPFEGLQDDALRVAKLLQTPKYSAVFKQLTAKPDGNEREYSRKSLVAAQERVNQSSKQTQMHEVGAEETLDPRQASIRAGKIMYQNLRSRHAAEFTALKEMALTDWDRSQIAFARRCLSALCLAKYGADSASAADYQVVERLIRFFGADHTGQMPRLALEAQKLTLSETDSVKARVSVTVGSHGPRSRGATTWIARRVKRFFANLTWL